MKYLVLSFVLLFILNISLFGQDVKTSKPKTSGVETAATLTKPKSGTTSGPSRRVTPPVPPPPPIKDKHSKVTKPRTVPNPAKAATHNK